MKKIIIAFDGLKHSDAAIDYALDIAKDSSALLVGVFLHDLSYLAMSYNYRWGLPFNSAWDIKYQADPKDEEKIKTNVALFSSKCEQQNIQYKVHVDRGIPVEELMRESIFADILIIDSRLAFSRISEDELSAQFIELLTEVSCPVLVVPAKFEKIDNAILTYDGSQTSTYALKMYSYIFPEWRDLPTKLVTVNEDDEHLKEKHHIEDLLNTKFSQLSIEVLKGHAKEELMTYLKSFANNSVVVMGAYGRPAISMLFKKSLANAVIREIMVPVFIAHP